MKKKSYGCQADWCRAIDTQGAAKVHIRFRYDLTFANGDVHARRNGRKCHARASHQRFQQQVGRTSIRICATRRRMQASSNRARKRINHAVLVFHIDFALSANRDKCRSWFGSVSVLQWGLDGFELFDIHKSRLSENGW